MNPKIGRRTVAGVALAAWLTAAGAAAQDQAPSTQESTPAAQRAAVEAETGSERAATEAETERAHEEAELIRGRAERMRERAATLAREEARVAQRHAEERSELALARAELEAAAREVARLAAETTAPVVADLRNRFVPRATLGLVVEDDDDAVRVLNVTPNGPAAAAGLATGDVIVAVDGKPLDESEAGSPRQFLAELVGDLEPGTPVRLALVDDGDEREVVVTTREAAPRHVFLRRRLDDLGDLDVLEGVRDLSMPRFTLLRTFDVWQAMELVALTPDLGRYFGTDEGMLVVRAPERDALGLRDGDVILAIGERVPSSPEHATRILASFEPGETLRMTIMRDGSREMLELEVPELDSR